MLSLIEADFPSTAGFVRAQWAPLLLRPILGSPEQFVIGVAVVNKKGFYLERANSFARLTCLFSGEASSAILAAQAALDALEADLSSRAMAALAEALHTGFVWFFISTSLIGIPVALLAFFVWYRVGISDEAPIQVGGGH